MEVTARELKLRLGRYLAAVRAGETVRITLRGRSVAEIRPIGATSESRLAQLAAQGRVRLGKGKLEPFEPLPAERSASALILADRKDERPDPLR